MWDAIHLTRERGDFRSSGTVTLIRAEMNDRLLLIAVPDTVIEDAVGDTIDGSCETKAFILRGSIEAAANEAIAAGTTIVPLSERGTDIPKAPQLLVSYLPVVGGNGSSPRASFGRGAIWQDLPN